MDRAPIRIHRQRTAGWRKPEGARDCTRSTVFGNPFAYRTRNALARVPATDGVTAWEYEGRISADGSEHAYCWPNGDITQHTIRYMTRDEVVATHRRALIAPTRGLRLTHGYAGSLVYVDVDLVRRELAGRDLMCFCKLTDPCHVDTLLWVANAPADQVKAAAEDEYEIIRAMAERVAALHPAVLVAAPETEVPSAAR